MTASEAVSAAASHLAAHKLRSLLTMLGMIFGVGAVISMLAIGEGAARQAQGLIERLGLGNVLIRARELAPQEAEVVRAKSPGLSPRDAAAIEAAVVGVEQVVPRVEIEPYKVRSEEGRAEARV